MNTIQKGSNKWYYTRCMRCGTDLNYTIGDVTVSGETDDPTLQRTITCPECGQLLFVRLLSDTEWAENGMEG